MENVKIVLDADPIDQTPEIPVLNEEEAKGFIEGFKEFISSGSMDAKATEISKKTGLPAREVSKNFLMKTLGIIGVTVDTGINMAGDLASTLINALGYLLLQGVDLIIRMAKRLVRIVTLNQGV